MAEPCMDTECNKPLPPIPVTVKVSTGNDEKVFSFCSWFCARESLDDTAGRALSDKGQVVMRA